MARCPGGSVLSEAIPSAITGVLTSLQVTSLSSEGALRIKGKDKVPCNASPLSNTPTRNHGILSTGVARVGVIDTSPTLTAFTQVEQAQPALAKPAAPPAFLGVATGL